MWDLEFSFGVVGLRFKAWGSGMARWHSEIMRARNVPCEMQLWQLWPDCGRPSPPSPTPSRPRRPSHPNLFLLRSRTYTQLSILFNNTNLHSRKLTWKPKKGTVKTTVLLKRDYMGFHVSLGEIFLVAVVVAGSLRSSWTCHFNRSAPVGPYFKTLSRR